MTTDIDSFGNKVEVGSYVYFQVKVVGARSLSIGRVVKINPSGALTLKAVNTHCMTLDDYVAYREATYERMLRRYKDCGEPVPKWVEEYKTITHTKRLDTASSCVLVPASVLPPEIIQVLA